jgi:hypothetical protein
MNLAAAVPLHVLQSTFPSLSFTSDRPCRNEALAEMKLLLIAVGFLVVGCESSTLRASSLRKRQAQGVGTIKELCWVNADSNQVVHCPH